MELSFKYMISVLYTAIITFIMISLLGLFLNFSSKKAELERIITIIETSNDSKETANRFNDRSDLLINEYDLGDKKQYYVELTSYYSLIGLDIKSFKLKGYTKAIEV